MKNLKIDNKVRKIFLNGIAVISLIIVIAIVCGFTDKPKGELVTETYIVQQGDTLWSISDKYMQKNDYGPRDIREFVSGIVESNYDDVFKYRDGNHYVYPNDQLKINYWVRKGEKPDD